MVISNLYNTYVGGTKDTGQESLTIRGKLLYVGWKRGIKKKLRCAKKYKKFIEQQLFPFSAVSFHF